MEYEVKDYTIEQCEFSEETKLPVRVTFQTSGRVGQLDLKEKDALLLSENEPGQQAFTYLLVEEDRYELVLLPVNGQGHMRWARLEKKFLDQVYYIEAEMLVGFIPESD